MALYAPSPPLLAGGHVTRYPYSRLDSSASESQQPGQGPLLLRLRRLPRTSRPRPHPESPPSVRPRTEGPSRPASPPVARCRSGRCRLSPPLALHRPPSLPRGSRWRPSTSALPLLQDHQNLFPRTEDVPTVEAVGDRLYIIALVRKVYRSPNTTQGLGRGEEESVVRAYEVSPALYLGGKRSPFGFISRVYHSQVHSVLRHIPRGVLEELRSPDHVEGGHSMRYVDYGSLGCDARDHTFARPHQLVGEAIVRY